MGRSQTPANAPAGESAAFNRFCSGTLALPGQLYDRDSGRGYREALWFANEEGGDAGLLFGVTADGTAQQLPRTGRFSTRTPSSTRPPASAR